MTVGKFLKTAPKNATIEIDLNFNDNKIFSGTKKELTRELIQLEFLSYDTCEYADGSLLIGIIAE